MEEKAHELRSARSRASHFPSVPGPPCSVTLHRSDTLRGTGARGQRKGLMQARQKLNFSTIMLGWRVVRDRRRLRDAEVAFAAHQKDTEAMRLPMLQRQSCSCSEPRAIYAPKHDVGQTLLSSPQFRDASRDDFAIGRIRGASRLPTGSGGEVECGEGASGDGGESS